MTGYSFIVDVGEKQLHARLYFVDSPEIHIKDKSSARRVQEQTRYFGLLFQRILFISD